MKEMGAWGRRENQEKVKLILGALGLACLLLTDQPRLRLRLVKAWGNLPAVSIFCEAQQSPLRASI